MSHAEFLSRLHKLGQAYRPRRGKRTEFRPAADPRQTWVPGTASSTMGALVKAILREGNMTLGIPAPLDNQHN